MFQAQEKGRFNFDAQALHGLLNRPGFCAGSTLEAD